MHQTNIIGAGIHVVDRFAHLDKEEFDRLKSDAAAWYDVTKRPMYGTDGKILADYKPSGIRGWFVWLSEQWYVRLLIGLFVTLVLMPWAKRVSSSGSHGERAERETSLRNVSRYGSDGFDQDGFDRSGFDRDGFDRDGYDIDGYDEDGYDRDGRHEDDTED